MHGTISWYSLIDLSNLNKLVIGPYFKMFYFVYVYKQEHVFGNIMSIKVRMFSSNSTL